MKNRFRCEVGVEIFTGNEMIVKGGLEAGISLMTGYPGSPVSDVFDVAESISSLLQEKGVLAQMANNEALAAARLAGARMADIRALAIMKSVGMHVASDALAIGNLSQPRKPNGGAVVVVGDDPWNETTQINSDSRYLSQHLHMPIIEPSTFQELKDWLDKAFMLSGACDLTVTYLITTNQADGGGSVRVRKNKKANIPANKKHQIDPDKISLSDYVLIPPHSSQREATLGERYQRFLKLARQNRLNQILYASQEHRSIGFVSSGLSYCYLEHALFELGLSGKFPILKMGVSYPLDQELVVQFAHSVDSIIVIEEKRDFVESQIKKFLAGEVWAPSVWGKTFPGEWGGLGIPSEKGINTSILIDRLGSIFLNLGDSCVRAVRDKIQNEKKLLEDVKGVQVDVPLRTPTFCPGCPHRDSSNIFLDIRQDFANPEYMKHKHGSNTVSIIFHGESGCHSMLQFAPNEGLMHNYSGMGLGGGTGAGIDPFISNKQVVFLGDSTFYHSGIISISDAIKNDQDILYVILDNKTTAMTGHQPTPGSDIDIMGKPTFAQDIEKILQGMGQGKIPVYRIDPAIRKPYRDLLEDLLLREGVKIVIADKECGITFQRRLRKMKKEKLKKEGFLREEKFINITPEVCEFCLECTRSTGCPGLTVEETPYGPKIATDLSTCVSDGACTKRNVCPSFEEVIIKRKKAPIKKSESQKKIGLPIPLSQEFENVWYAATFAVGGMGAGVVTAILATAGHKQGYRVMFLDKKGLAIRNGGVYGHISFSKSLSSDQETESPVLSPVVPYGKADLILGLDLLEAVRGVDPSRNLCVASPSRTAAVVNSQMMPTLDVLLGKDQMRPMELQDILKRQIRPDGFVTADFSHKSEKYFGTKLYSNVVILGAAFQKGFLPLSLESLEVAIRDVIAPSERDANLEAFSLGRQMVVNPLAEEKLGKKPLRIGHVIQEKSEILSRRWKGASLAKAYRKLLEVAVRWTGFSEEVNAHLALRIYDLIQYEDFSLARFYVERLLFVYRRDRKDKESKATLAVLYNLFKVLAIKDEVYVAHLLTSEEKRLRDLERYKLSPDRGDRISYRHLNRPSFPIFGRSFEFNITTRDWMLKIFKKFKWIRRWKMWHRREKEFRDWYIGLVGKFNYIENDHTYEQYVEAMKVPETCTGYRDILYPKLERAQARARVLLDEKERSFRKEEHVTYSN